MVRAALAFAWCLPVAFGVDEASLLQANAGKKRLQTSSSTAQWIEELAQSPNDVITRVSNMLPSEQKSLLQQFASADASSLAKEIEPHKVALALAFRGSPVQAFAQGPTSQWVSALQHRTGEVESAIASKKDQIRKRNDGKNASSFPDQFEHKDVQYLLSGGRCRTGAEFSDIPLEVACEVLCDSDDGCDSSSFEVGACQRLGDAYNNESETEEETCEDLCALDDLCSSFEAEEGVCKRFTTNLRTYKRTTLMSCAKKCSKKDECESFEWDNGECELHDNSTDELLSAEEAVEDTNACYFKNATSSD